MTSDRPTEAATRQWSAPLVALAAVVYPPLLLTAPGRVVADTKSYLYLDPGRLLERALTMWDPHVGMGTVPHQQIGYLWPMGPYYWVMEQVGAPDWVAQRLWIGSIMVGAGAGVLFLARTWRWRPDAAAAAAFVYALSPYVLTLAARISVILLAFAGLPWLLALTVRALRTRGWRHPALFGLVVATIGSVNATALLLVGIVPVGWILYALATSPDISRARATTTMAKIGLVTVVVNAWWISALSVQATNGLNVLRYTETAEVIANASTAPEVLRGLGYWFFYGGDRLGPWIEPGSAYTQNLLLLGVSYAIPVIGLIALGITRWRDRAFVVAMLVVGTVIAVGAHPWDDPSAVGELFKLFLSTDLGLAMRSLPRAVPLVALAVALGIGALVGACAQERSRRGVIGAVLAATLAVGAFPALWTGQFVPENLQRPEEIPSYWHEAAEHLDERDDGTRVLEIPGIDFASYRWGNTVDPVTPGLIDRPYVARELIPYGSPASADLLNALDLRLQERIFDPDALAPLARLMAVGDIVTRNDLQYERYNTPRPRSLWQTVTAAEGLGDPQTFGPRDPNVPVDEAPLLDPLHLARDGALADPPPVAAFPVLDPEPIVRTRPADRAVLLSGDGAGIVDAAMAGLIRGDELIRYSATVTDDPDFAREHLDGVRALVVTDTNRRRAERWSTVRHTRGFTEEAGGGLIGEADPTDQRLPLFEDRPGIHTVAEHRGLTVRATGYGNPISYTPEERPVNAVDGDATTAWRVAAFEDAVGHRIEVTSPTPATTDHVTLLQPINGAINRTITEVELRFDGEDPVRAVLDESSQTRPGQRVEFPERTFEQLSIEILADSAGRRPGYGGLTSVGFASIGIDGRTAEELIRMPSDLLDAGGYRTIRYPLALVQTRQRSVATDVTRMDEEHAMRRVVDLPTERSYRLSGSARVASEAPTSTLDALLGRGGVEAGLPVVDASSVLPGALTHLPSNVLDGDPGTWWTSAFGSPGEESLSVRTPSPVTIDEFDITVVDDDEHSTPQSLSLTADGEDVGVFELDLAPNGDGTATATVTLPRPVTASELEIAFTDIRVRKTINWSSDRPEALPVAVAEVGIDGLTVPERPPRVDTGCRDDLVTVEGRSVPVRVTGSTDDALAGRSLDLLGCEPVTVSGGERVFRTAEGRRLGIDIDQLVWCSAGGGTPCEDRSPLLPAAPSTAPTSTVVDSDDATVDVRIDGATPGVPFWLVLGQSHNSGWEITDEDVEHEETQLVDGYANGFLVTPSQSSFEVTMRFVPQNRVDVGLLLSLIGVAGALLLVALPTRQLRPARLPLLEPIRRLRATAWEGGLPTTRQAIAVGLVSALTVALVVTPVIGLAVGVLAGLATRRERWRPLFTLGAPILLTTCVVYLLVFQYRNDIGPGLHWATDTGRLHDLGMTAVLMLAIDVGIDRVWAWRSVFR